ncbi:MAG TPA: pyridoxamine 5'-phosphate oxidase family protein [Rhizobiales bacterium]|nr:pyridoxamine 5'-phosphate oxidase [bacterium BMS3Bbin10]HDO51283.1 pyridoxamine 5'-phosphate oxidase family protein [Hyphomicrobiales bacterium]
MNTYAKTKLNKVRKSDRASYDKETVHAILDEALLAHVGFTDNDWPMVIPMIYGRIGETLYLHGAKAARIAKTLGKGVPVCIEVTLVDALVLARSAFHSSMNYRSVVIHGMARQVTDADEMTQALAQITDHLAPGRWDEARPMNDKELKSTGVFAVPIEHAVAKARTGGPIDDDEDYALPVWSGVIPVRHAFGAPQDDGRLLDGVEVPASVVETLKRHA